MILIIGLSLLALWVVGFVFFHVTGFLIHILFIVAAVMILMRVIRGK